MTSRMTGPPSGPAQPKAADLRWGVGKDPAGEDYHHMYTPHTYVYIYIYIIQTYYRYKCLS